MHYHSQQKKIIPRPVVKAMPQLPDMHPLMQRIYSARGISSIQQLQHSLAHLPSPWLLSGMDKMVQLLLEALEKQQKIMIVADFDADGATSCAVALKGLALLGFDDVQFIVPNRFEFGYGLTPEIVNLAATENPQVILTVDNGISSVAGVARAKKLGFTVLITDHHLPGERLPDADAIVNPNISGQEFPSGALAGVGVLFYVLMALRNRLREQNTFADSGLALPNLAQLLDYVALGTVADVVPLDFINRILVYQGLQRIRSSHCHAGLKALIEVSGRQQQSLQASDLGFALGPRLNAAGRMDDMTLGIQCLVTDDSNLAREIALQLDDFNADRRAIEGQMKQEAMELLAQMKAFDAEHIPAGICLFDQDWHPGVIGILAGRVKDRLHRPVIAFAPSSAEGEIKGSARSIPGLHIRDVLSDIAAAHPNLLSKFGGHAMAAGMTIKMSDYPPFSMAFNEFVAERLQAINIEQTIYSDGQLPEQQLTLQFAELLQQGGPWGQEFPEPVFDGVYDVIQVRIVGQQHLKLVLREPFGEVLVDGIAFFVEQPENWLGIRQIKVAYNLAINEYRGARNIQLIIQYLEKKV